jgi:hypothetical protein
MSVEAAWPRQHLGDAMAGFGTTGSATDDSYLRTRDFDYGVQDEVRFAAEQLRGEIAARIRRAVYSDPNATRQDRYAYEMAARIAERA